MTIHVDLVRVTNKDEYAIHMWFQPIGGGLNDTLYLGQDGKWHSHKAGIAEEPCIRISGQYHRAADILFPASILEPKIPGKMTWWKQRKLRRRLGVSKFVKS